MFLSESPSLSAVSLYFRPFSASPAPPPDLSPASAPSWGAPSLNPGVHSSLRPRLASPPWSQLLQWWVPEMLQEGLSWSQRGRELAGAGEGTP